MVPVQEIRVYYVAVLRTQPQQPHAVFHAGQTQHALVVTHVHIIQTHVLGKKPVMAILLGAAVAQPLAQARVQVVPAMAVVVKPALLVHVQ